MSIFCHLFNFNIHVWTVFGKYFKGVNAIRAHVSHCDSRGCMRNNHFVLLNTIFQCWTVDFCCKTSCWLSPLRVRDAHYSNILGKGWLILYISQLTSHVGGYRYIILDVLLNKVGVIQINICMFESLRRNPYEIISNYKQKLILVTCTRLFGERCHLC